MATTPLLPRPINRNENWGTHPAGFISVNVEDVRRRLALAEHLALESIASPWARLHYMRWVLEDQQSEKGQEMVEVIKLIVLLQFLGHLEGQLVSLTPGELGWLGPLLKTSWGARAPEPLVLWKIRELGASWDGQVFAGSSSASLFFPGAAFYPDENRDDPDHILAWRNIRDALLTRHGPNAAAPLLDDMEAVSDPHLATSLSQYLGRFIDADPDSGLALVFRTWQISLNLQGQHGQSRPVARLNIPFIFTSATGQTVSISFGRYTGGEAVWSCPLCEQEQEAWINTSGRQSVTSRNLAVVCHKHNRPLQTGAGAPIDPSHYRAYPAPNGILYVWTDAELRPDGCTDVTIQGSLGEEGSVIYKFNRQEIQVRGLLVSKDTVLLQDVAWMARKDREEPLPVDIPVTGEYALLVESCKSDPLNNRWEIQFHGLRNPVQIPQYPQPIETLWESSTILIWPPQEYPGWSLDYIATSTPRSARARFRLIEQEGGEGLVPSPVMQTNALYRTKKGRIRYVEVGEELADQSFKSLGLLKIERPAVVPAPGGGPGHLVLDFGTSNSAILTRVVGDNPHFINSGVPEATLETSAFFPTHVEADFNQLLQGVDILSPWNPEKPAHSRPYLPSLLAKPQFEQSSQHSIPPRGRGLDLLLNPGTQPRILNGLKWKDWNAPGIQSQIESLIELFLLPAFWQLRVNGCLAADLVVTYPLAFDTNQKKKYQTIVDVVAGRLSERTGLTVNPVSLHSESAAGACAFLQITATYIVTLDLGGGTTDLAVLVGNVGKNATAQEMGTVLAADSIEYGGRDFLRAIVVAYGPELVHKMFTKAAPDLLSPSPPADSGGQTDELVDAYVDCLEALLHREGLVGLDHFIRSVPDTMQAKAMNQKYENVIMRWEALLVGLLFYACRMVEACIADVSQSEPIKVSFNLLGQGWDLLRLLGENIPPVKEIVDPHLTDLLASEANIFISVDAPQIQEAKTTVVSGAYELKDTPAVGPRGKYRPVIAANVRKTFAGMVIFNEDDKNNPVVDLRTPLVECHPRPDWPSDPGYGKLIDEIFDAIPQYVHGTHQPWRKRVQNLLLSSGAYQEQWGTRDVRQHLIGRGQDDLNRTTWPPGDQNPARSLLGGFLTSVWRKVWASTKL